jgi:hypothetical protein
MSTLSILAQCVDTNPQAVSPYRSRLLNAMLDLLQIESLHAQKQVSADSKSSTTSPDSEPTTTDPKIAEFRRAALHLLEMLVRSTIHERYSKHEELYRVSMNVPSISFPSTSSNKPVEPLDKETLQRMSVVLGYVSAIDVDSVVRFMAKELLEMIHS